MTMAVAPSDTTSRPRSLIVLAALTAALTVDATVVAVRYSLIVESDKAGDAALAIVVAVLGAAAVVASLASSGRGRVARGAAAAVVVPFALMTFLVGLLSLADGEVVGAGLRTVAAAAIVALIKPGLFPVRSSSAS